MKRPDTHPGELYRRAREALAVQLADTVHLLAHLDPDEQFAAGDELLELLADVAAGVDDVIAGYRYLPPRPIETVDTGGRL